MGLVRDSIIDGPQPYPRLEICFRQVRPVNPVMRCGG